jgi:hypothetical protein
LSGVALPSCCAGSSQRGAILVCHASVILPFGVTPPAAAPAFLVKTNGIPLAVRAALCNNVRRVSLVMAIPPIRTRLGSFKLCVPSISAGEKNQASDLGEG